MRATHGALSKHEGQEVPGTARHRRRLEMPLQSSSMKVSGFKGRHFAWPSRLWHVSVVTVLPPQEQFQIRSAGHAYAIPSSRYE